MLKSCVVALSGFVLVGLFAPGAGAAPRRVHSALDVARNLDVTSFPNSIGPRRERGKTRLRDYGFTDLRVHGSRVDIYEQPERDWLIAITVLHDLGARKIICFVDQNIGGGTYHVVEPIEIVRGRGGLYHATKRRPRERSCPTYIH